MPFGGCTLQIMQAPAISQQICQSDMARSEELPVLLPGYLFRSLCRDHPSNQELLSSGIAVAGSSDDLVHV